jgi:hypothetical protein
LVFDYLELRRTVGSLGYSQDVTNAVVAAAVALDQYPLSDADKGAVFELLSDAGRKKLGDLPEKLVTGRWREDFDYGNVKIGDYVRVRPGAYDSDTGSKHNGKVGVLASVAARLATVEYIGDGNGRVIKHPISNLQSLMW